MSVILSGTTGIAVPNPKPEKPEAPAAETKEAPAEKQTAKPKSKAKK